MIIVFADDQTVEVFSDLGSVRGHCEAIDVEEGCFRFFDEKGWELRPRIITPVRRTALPLGVQLVGGGNFDLELASESEDGAFERLLDNVVAIEPNKWFQTKSDLARHVAENRRA